MKFVADVIRHLAPERAAAKASSTPEQTHRPLTVVALIESALGLSNLRSICSTGHSLGVLSGIAFAAEDFAEDLSLSPLPNRREMLFARSAIVTAGQAHKIGSIIDMVSTSVGGDDWMRKLEDESHEGRALGFTGEQCIHPLQIGAIQSAFGPSQKELEWALRVIDGDAYAQEQRRGVWRLDGEMVDAPVVKRAQALLSRAKMCGDEPRASSSEKDTVS